MNFKSKALLVAVGLVMAAGSVTTASAETPWQANHQRRVEVNHRLAMQNVRIREERKLGEISAIRAHRLHAEVRRVRFMERRDARMHRTHLTFAEQARLNRAENHINRQIIRR